MKVLAHIHTFNDEDVIDRSLQAILDQTWSIPEVLLIDNASSDGTLKRDFPAQVTILRHPKNLGTNGAVISGFQYAIERGYDWIWLFDADTAPHPNALQRLFSLYATFPEEVQRQTWRLSSLPVDFVTKRPNHGCVFTWFGIGPVRRRPGQVYYECDGSIWTGSLFKLQAVQIVGLPSPDYVLDLGEFAYSYQGKKSGYRSFVHQESIVDHNIGGEPGLSYTQYRFGGFTWKLRELPPIRCYYLTRNYLYFGLYVYQEQRFFSVMVCLLRIVKLIGSFVLRPHSRRPQFTACMRGLRDGLLKQMHRRFGDEDPRAHSYIQR